MENLSAKELKVFNNLSKVQTPSVALGDKVQEIISALASKVESAPVNAVAATATLDIEGEAIHGEIISINNPVVTGIDTYEFSADDAQSVSEEGNIAVDITGYTTKSTGVLTVAVQPTSGDEFTIGDKDYIFVPNGTNNADGEIAIGDDLADAQANIVAAINGTDGVNDANTLAIAGDFNSDDSDITAIIGGTAGDTIETSSNFTNIGNSFSAISLSGGADCSAANAITALVAAITASDTQGVGAVGGTGDSIDFEADIAGEAGNDIVIDTPDEDGNLSGGVDGTVASILTIQVTDDYLYIAIDDNTVADSNWRRISLGTVY